MTNIIGIRLISDNKRYYVPIKLVSDIYLEDIIKDITIKDGKRIETNKIKTFKLVLKSLGVIEEEVIRLKNNQNYSSTFEMDDLNLISDNYKQEISAIEIIYSDIVYETYTEILKNIDTITVEKLFFNQDTNFKNPKVFSYGETTIIYIANNDYFEINKKTFDYYTENGDCIN